MTVKTGNFFYFMYIAVGLGLAIGLCLILKHRTAQTQKITLAAILFTSFALHFLKLAFEPYRSGLPASFRKSTFENICAVSTLIFPFIFLSKNKTLRDYMFYLGCLSGLAALAYPTEALGKNPFLFDVIRFYFCHISILAVPLAMTALGLHKLDYRRVWRVPLVFLAVLCLILVNEIILIEAGFVDMRTDDFLSPSYRNSSFIFGPLPAFEKLAPILTWMTPKLFLTVPFGPLKGQTKYWPVLWLAIPAFVYLTLLSFLMSLPFEHKRVGQDIGRLAAYFKSLRKRKTKPRRIGGTAAPSQKRRRRNAVTPPCPAP